MKAMIILCHTVTLFIIFLLAMPMSALSQDAEGVAPSTPFTKEELAQMLAPVALYPDSLLAQILMASTYPLEVIEADRWIKQNPALKGNVLDEALIDNNWDSSVQSLCYFPAVLGMMSEHITEITRMGNAFLAQQNDVMDMIQELRARAKEQGNLASTPEENVVDSNGSIRIEPTDPEVIYVPEYNPLYVYGPWWYPAYPPYYWAPGPIGGWISFYPGYFVGVDIGSWCFFDWHNSFVFVDFDKRHRFHRGRDHDRDRNDRRGKASWRHDPDHRRGVAYMDRYSAQKFGQSPSLSRETGRNVRGYPERSQTEPRPKESIQRTLEKGSTIRSDRRGAERMDIQNRVPRVEQGGARITVIPKENVRPNAFSTTNEGGGELKASERGRTSRESFRSSSGNIAVPRGNTAGSHQSSSPQSSVSPRSSGSHESNTPRSSGGPGGSDHQRSGDGGKGDRRMMGR